MFVPVICGINTGQHMYLDAGGVEGNMPITIAHEFTGMAADRVWNYKISQVHTSDAVKY